MVRTMKDRVKRVARRAGRAIKRGLKSRYGTLRRPKIKNIVRDVATLKHIIN